MNRIVCDKWVVWVENRGCKGRALFPLSQTKVIDKVYTYVWPPARFLLYLIEDVKGDAKRTQRGRKEDVNRFGL
jgi:hypothetical protein